MMTLDELIDHCAVLSAMAEVDAIKDNAAQLKALEVAAQMLSALITQLDSQSISFTP